MIKKFTFIVFLLFFSLILSNANSKNFKIKDLEIKLFDKNKQIKASKSIREGYGRVEIKVFAEKTDENNIGPIILIMQSKFEKYGSEVRNFYLDYFFNSKNAIFDNESANYQIINKKKSNAFQVKEFDLEKFLNTSDDFMEIKRAIRQLYKKNSFKINDRLLKSDHLYSISNGNAVWISYMFNYETVIEDDFFENGVSKFHPKNINNFPNYKTYMNKWSELAFKRHEDFQTKLKLNSQIDLKSLGFDNKNDLKYYENNFYSDKFYKDSVGKLQDDTELEKKRKAKEEEAKKAAEQKAKEEEAKKAADEKSNDELSVDDIMTKIKELNEMYKSGLISKEEFEMLKNKLLKN